MHSFFHSHVGRVVYKLINMIVAISLVISAFVFPTKAQAKSETSESSANQILSQDNAQISEYLTTMPENSSKSPLLIDVRNALPPAYVKPAKQNVILYSDVYCPEGFGYCYTSDSGYFSVADLFRTYDEGRALSPEGDCNFGSGNYTNVMAPDSGGDAWVIFDLGEVFEIKKFTSWDLHHGIWKLEYSEDEVNWNTFDEGTTSWQNERCGNYDYDLSASPANIRYLRYSITQQTNVGNAYRIAWFSFLSNTPSKYHPTLLYYHMLSSGSTKNGTGDSRECPLGKCTGATGNVADPVNTRTGSFDYSVEDISIPTSAGQLVFQRSYSSGSGDLNLYVPGTDTVLGYGWTHNQDIYLDIQENGDIRLKAQSANQYLFTANPDGTYTPYAGVTASLSYDSLTDEYTLSDSGQTEYTFDENGKITRWESSTGQAFTYLYDNGELSRISDPTGDRYLEFFYTDGLLTTVEDYTGRSLSYSYDSSQDLVTYTDILGNIYHYTYDSDHRITTVQLEEAANPASLRTEVRNIFDDSGRVVCQQEGDAYPPVTGFNHLYNQVHCLQANGELAAATSITYNADLTATLIDQLGYISTQGYNINQNTFSGSTDNFGNASTQTLDSNFKLNTLTDAANNTTQMEWSEDGANLTSLTDALDHTTSLDYDGSNHLTEVTNPDETVTKVVYNTPGVLDPLTEAAIYNPDWDEDLVLMEITNFVEGSIDPDANLVTRYTYTTASDAPEPPNLLRKIEAPGSDTCYSYDEYGQQTHVYTNCVDMDPETGDSNEDIETQTEYDVLGRVTATTDANGYVTRYEYYDVDNNADAVIRNYEESKGPYEDGLWNFTTLYTYDSEGKSIDTVTNAFDGDLTGDEQVEPILTLDFDHDGIPEYRLEIDPDKPEYNIITHNTYDSNGRPTESITNYWPGHSQYYLNLYNFSTRYYYDPAGRVVVQINNYYDGDLPGYYGSTFYQIFFDEFEINTGRVEVNFDFPEYNQVTRTEYDKAGRIAIIRKLYSGNGNYFHYTYGDQARMRKIYDLLEAYEYDDVGNVTKTINNYDPNLTDSDGDGFSVQVKIDGVYRWIKVDPDAPDRNQITCTTYDALNRPVFIRTACVPGQPDYLQVGDALYNVVSFTAYDEMGQQYANIRNYYDPDADGVLEFSSQYNFITRTFYNSLGQVEYTVDNFVGDVSSPAVPAFDPAAPDRNLVTRYYYDTDGTQIAVVKNYWEPPETADGELTQTEVEAGFPDRNLISRLYTDEAGRTTTTIQNFVSSSIFDPAPVFDQAFPDRNIRTDYYYDAAGQQIGSKLWRAADGSGSITRTYFDALNRATTTIQNLSDWDIYDPQPPDCLQVGVSCDEDSNIRSDYSYDNLGDQIASQGSDGTVSRSYYDARQQVVASVDNFISASIEDPLPVFDPQVTDENVQSQTEYTAAGTVMKTIDPNGGEVYFCYDASGREVKHIENPTVGNPCLDYTANAATDRDQVTLTGYDPSGNRISVVDSNGFETKYTYDNLNRLVKQTDPMQHVTRNVYDAAGNQIGLVDAKGIVTKYEYDATGRLTAVIENYQEGMATDQETNVRTEYEYDAAGNREAINDGLGHQTLFSYDAMGRVENEEDALSHQITYTYDAAGNQASLTDANGVTTHYYYDDLDRQTLIDYPAPDADVAFTYYLSGTRHTMTDGVGITTWTYDALGRPETIQDPYQQTTGYAYDAVGNRTRLIYPDDKTVSYVYDQSGRLAGVTGWDGQHTTYTWDRGGRAATTTLPNSVVATSHYDSAGRLTSLGYTRLGKSLSSFVYTVDEVGNRTAVVESHLPSSSIPLPQALTAVEEGFLAIRLSWPDSSIIEDGYTLERSTDGEHWLPVAELGANVLEYVDYGLARLTPYWYRLTAHNSSGGSEVQTVETGTGSDAVTYTDPERVETSITYGYDALYRLTDAVNNDGTNFHYTYDSVGNRLSETTAAGTTSYSYDAANRLANVNETEYQWDDNGNLLNDGTYIYTYDHANRLITINNQGSVISSYSYNGQGDRLTSTTSGILKTYTLDLNAGLTQVLADGAQTYLYGNGRLEQESAASIEYFIGDALGSVRQLVDESGEVRLNRSYEPYGEVLASDGEAETDYAFTGENYDPQTGLVYLRARYYASGDGKFISRDTWVGNFRRPVSYNKWNYSYSNPIIYTDPSGQDPITDCGALFLLAATVDGPLPIGDAVGVGICAVIFGTAAYTAIMASQHAGDLARSVDVLGDRCTLTWEDLLGLPEPVPEPSPEPVPTIDPFPPKIPTETPEPSTIVIIYRGLDGDINSERSYFKKPITSPSQFRVDVDGVSTFELADLPGNKPYALGLKVKVKTPIVPGSNGPVVDIPICTGTFTPELGGGLKHWSVICSGTPTNIALSEYAKGIGKTNIILNPQWVGEPYERRLP